MNQSYSKVAEMTLPVLLMGAATLPQETCLHPMQCVPAQVTNPEGFAAQLYEALQCSPTAVVLGGFFGDIWPAVSAICGVMAYTAHVPEDQVRFRWIKDGETALGAEVKVLGLTVYAVPDDLMLSARMLQYIGHSLHQLYSPQWELNSSAKSQKRPKSKSAIALIVVAAIMAVTSGGWLVNHTVGSARNQRLNDSIVDRFNRDREAEVLGSSYPLQRLARFDSLYEENSDIVGWLDIPAADIHLPVMRGDCNEFYLYHDFYRRSSRFGAIFIDKQNDITPGQMSSNISVFGHMTRNGTMFGQLNRFRAVSFVQENPTFRFTTLYEEIDWVIFAMFITNANPRQDNGNFFEYRETRLQNSVQMEEFLEEIHERSMIRTGVDVEHGDQLLSLTTCTYEFQNARFVIFARRVRPGEQVDLSGAQAVRDFRRPAAWR